MTRTILTAAVATILVATVQRSTGGRRSRTAARLGVTIRPNR